MRRRGVHKDFGGVDAAVGVAREFTTRAFGVNALKGKHIELHNMSPEHPEYRKRQARKMWLLLQRGALRPEVVEDVKKRFAREFGQFARRAAV
jgi:hypothetical protein